MKLGILLLLSASAFAQYWPSTTWRTATPESQGLDSQILSNAITKSAASNSESTACW